MTANISTTSLVTIDEQRNVPMTTSLKVAEVFKKEHKHVMEAIRNLIDRGLPNFRPSSYTNLQNKQQPMFLMDRKGFVLLVMGFTGDSALEFKSRYIDEFDRMEQKLREQAAPSFSLPQTLAEALEFAAKQVREKEALAIENAEVRQSLTEMKPKADTYDAVVKSKDICEALGLRADKTNGSYQILSTQPVRRR